MQEVLQLGLRGHNHLADVLKEVPGFLEIAVATLNQAQALLDEVGLISVVI